MNFVESSKINRSTTDNLLNLKLIKNDSKPGPLKNTTQITLLLNLDKTISYFKNLY